MDNRAVRTPEGSKAIIEYNINVLYHLPKRFYYLELALRDVRGDLLDILNYIKKIPSVIWHQKYTWYLDNKKLTAAVRKKTTYAVSNRHFNYLCCIGVLNKLPQRGESMIGINKEFMLETGNAIPMNVITVYKYTEKELERLNNRAAVLLEHKITPGNISNDKLLASGCEELAREVFYANSETSLQKKEKLLEVIIEYMEHECTNRGYTTKKDICQALDITRDVLDKLLKVFSEKIGQQYIYKSPNKTTKEKYGLESNAWIFTRR